MQTKKLLTIGLILIAILTSVAASQPDKIVVIRDDDVYDSGPALGQFVDTIKAYDAAATLAVIPNKLTPMGINYLKALEPWQFELATHGYNHDGSEDAVLVQPAAKALMIQYFNMTPVSIAAPNSKIPIGYVQMAKSLGYHSQINGLDIPDVGTLYTFPINFEWETDWGTEPNWTVTYATFDDFQATFDQWYLNGISPVFTINCHHGPMWDNWNVLDDFKWSLDYMQSKNVTFMTEDQAYHYMQTHTTV